MASPSKDFWATLLSLLLAIALADYCHANIHSVSHAIGRQGLAHDVPHVKHHRPKFKPGPWIKAHATFYDGGPTSFGTCLLLPFF